MLGHGGGGKGMGRGGHGRWGAERHLLKETKWCYVAHLGFELAILLPQPPGCCYRYEPPVLSWCSPAGSDYAASDKQIQ